MPATPEEMESLVGAFENAHPPLARALADLLIRGRGILEDHRLSDDSVIADFEGLLGKLAQEHEISEEMLSAAVAALRRIHVTVEQLERLP